MLKGDDHEFETERELILDAVVEGICGLDADGRATFCNDAVLKMTGYRAEEVVGKDVHELLHHGRPDGTLYPAEECFFRKALEANQPAHVMGEFLWRKNGTCFPIEYWARPIERPGSRMRHVATLKDTTDIEQAKDALHNSEEKYRRILASAPDVAWTSNRHGRTIYVSPKAEAVLGYTLQEIFSGTLLVSKGQEVTPTVIFKLKNFHVRRAVQNDVAVSLSETSLAFVKGAS